MTRRTFALMAVAWCLLSPAWADVTATVGMTAGQSLDLDTGALGTGTAADLLYTGFNGVLGPLGNGTGLTFVNGAFRSSDGRRFYLR